MRADVAVGVERGRGRRHTRMIAGLLATFGVPPEGIGLVLGVDRILDMLRTTVNVGSDIVTATVVDAQTSRSSKV